MSTPSDERPDRATEADPPTKPSDRTADADRRDAAVTGHADRPPTPEEEAAAESQPLDPDVAESYQEAIERGADVEGEGKI